MGSTDWNNLVKYLRPHMLRQLREDLRDQLDDDNKQELDPFIAEITEMLVDLDGDEAPAKDAGFV